MITAFFDTNVILYAIAVDDWRAEIAGNLLRAGGWISVQVLNELTNVSQRKLRHEWWKTEEMVTLARGYLTVRDLTVDTHELGIDIAKRYKVAIYDA